MLKIRYHKQFKKDFKLAMKRGLKAELEAWFEGRIIRRSFEFSGSRKRTSCQIS